jgi:hypothetical protein
MENRRRGRSAEELRKRIDLLKKKWEAEQRRRLAPKRALDEQKDGRARKKMSRD